LLEQAKGTITRLETELATKQSAVEAAEAAQQSVVAAAEL
jgi:hypothetical protein